MRAPRGLFQPSGILQSVADRVNGVCIMVYVSSLYVCILYIADPNDWLFIAFARMIKLEAKEEEGGDDLQDAMLLYSIEYIIEYKLSCVFVYNSDPVIYLCFFVCLSCIIRYE